MEKIISIWFDGWFSTAYNIIELIKNNPDNRKFKIIGSHNKEMVYKALCDEWYIRPIREEYEDDKEYLKEARSFCKTHNIDIFFPRRGVTTDYLTIKLFNEVGTKIVVENYDIMHVCNNKYNTYNILHKTSLLDYIPPTQKLIDVRLIPFFENYLQNKEFNYRKLCIKPEVGVGAEGFRVIDYPFDSKEIRDLLKENKEDYLLMPYLDGPEYSVDCLNVNQNKTIVCCREKNSYTKVQKIDQNEKIASIIKVIQDTFNFQYIYNVQFRQHEKELYLLEINTRMSGGIYLDDFAGVNFPYLLIKKLLDEEINLKTDIKAIKSENPINVCKIERGVIINGEI